MFCDLFTIRDHSLNMDWGASTGRSKKKRTLEGGGGSKSIIPILATYFGKTPFPDAFDSQSN